MGKEKLLGFDEALQLCSSVISPLPDEMVSLHEVVDRVLAEDISARVDSPSVDGSSKDGYAVISEDIKDATGNSPVVLKLAGTLYAGGSNALQVSSGTAVRILTGAEIPGGATAVVAEEFTRLEGEKLLVMNTAEPGRNIIYRGSDVKQDEPIARRGEMVSPGLVGLAAAAGHSSLPVARRPRVALVATGDEIVSPGSPLPRGKLYASNVATLAGWCRRFGFAVDLEVVDDEVEAIRECFNRMLEHCDAMVTSGGAWTGDHDLVAKVLAEMGGKFIFHRLRIGPGKATGLCLLSGKPVFILPGGPPSNLMGFLQLALPGLMQLAGSKSSPLQSCRARCGEEVRTGHANWTQFIFGRLVQDPTDALPTFIPLLEKSRLRSMAEAEAILAVPEGETQIGMNAIVTVQRLH